MVVNSCLPGQNGRNFGTQHFQMHFLEWKWYNSDSDFTEFFFRSPIDNKPALVQVMAWRCIGDKPLPEPMMAQFTDAYMWH